MLHGNLSFWKRCLLEEVWKRLTIWFSFSKVYLIQVTEEGLRMKKSKRMFLFLLTLSLVVTSFCPIGWATDNSLGRNDPVADEFYALDILLARPIGIVAGIVGSAIFVVSLPFTIPTKSVGDAADIFIVKPFQFSFVRQFPDNDI